MKNDGRTLPNPNWNTILLDRGKNQSTTVVHKYQMNQIAKDVNLSSPQIKNQPSNIIKGNVQYFKDITGIINQSSKSILEIQNLKPMKNQPSNIIKGNVQYFKDITGSINQSSKPILEIQNLKPMENQHSNIIQGNVQYHQYSNNQNPNMHNSSQDDTMHKLMINHGVLQNKNYLVENRKLTREEKILFFEKSMENESLFLKEDIKFRDRKGRLEFFMKVGMELNLPRTPSELETDFKALKRDYSKLVEKLKKSGSAAIELDNYQKAILRIGKPLNRNVSKIISNVHSNIDFGNRTLDASNSAYHQEDDCTIINSPPSPSPSSHLADETNFDHDFNIPSPSIRSTTPLTKRKKQNIFVQYSEMVKIKKQTIRVDGIYAMLQAYNDEVNDMSAAEFSNFTGGILDLLKEHARLI